MKRLLGCTSALVGLLALTTAAPVRAQHYDYSDNFETKQPGSLTGQTVGSSSAVWHGQGQVITSAPVEGTQSLDSNASNVAPGHGPESAYFFLPNQDIAVGGTLNVSADVFNNASQPRQFGGVFLQGGGSSYFNFFGSTANTTGFTSSTKQLGYGPGAPADLFNNYKISLLRTSATTVNYSFFLNNALYTSGSTDYGKISYVGVIAYNIDTAPHDLHLHYDNFSASFDAMPAAAVPELSTMLGFGSFVALGGIALLRQRKQASKAA